MLLHSLRMSIFLPTKLTGILLPPVNIHVLFQLGLAEEELVAMLATKFGHLRIMGLHVHFQGVGICIILLALRTVMLSLFEVLAFDVISELLSVIISFVAQLTLLIFARKSLLKYFQAWLLCMFGTHLGYPSSDTFSPPGNANQSSPA